MYYMYCMYCMYVSNVCTILSAEFQTIKQKVHLLPENLNQLSNLNMGLVLVMLLLIDISSN